MNENPQIASTHYPEGWRAVITLSIWRVPQGFPAEPDIKKRINNLGGAGIIAGLPGGHTRIGGHLPQEADKYRR